MKADRLYRFTVELSREWGRPMHLMEQELTNSDLYALVALSQLENDESARSQRAAEAAASGHKRVEFDVAPPESSELSSAPPEVEL